MTFGGGLTMLPMLEKEVITERKWVDKDTLLDYYAISQCTPGIIAINVSTFIGYSQAKTKGAIVSTLGMISPSLVIILGIAMMLEPFMSHAIVQSAFQGIRIGVCALLFFSIYNLWKNQERNIRNLALCMVSFIIVYFMNVSPVVIVLFIAFISLLLVWRERKSGNDK